MPDAYVIDWPPLALAIGVVLLVGSVALATFNIGKVVTRVAAWVEQRVSNAIRREINGSIARVDVKVTDLQTWADRHDRRHDRRERALDAWMRRNGMEPPDGWTAGP